MAYLNSRVGQDQNDQMSPGGLEGYTIQGRCNKPLFAQLLVVFCRERCMGTAEPETYLGRALTAILPRPSIHSRST